MAESPTLTRGRSVGAAIRDLLRDRRVRRYVGIGAASLAFSFCLLYLLVDDLGIPVSIAPLIVAETAIVLRFLAYDRFVFGNARPTWRRAGKFHMGVASGFMAFVIVTHVLIAGGMYYLLAATIGTGGSIGINVAANFLWIWRKPADPGT